MDVERLRTYLFQFLEVELVLLLHGEGGGGGRREVAAVHSSLKAEARGEVAEAAGERVERGSLFAVGARRRGDGGG